MSKNTITTAAAGKAEALEAVVAHRKAGRAWAEVLRLTGVGHSAAELAEWIHDYHVEGQHEPMDVTDPEVVVALRDYFGWSWGRIAAAGPRKADMLAPKYGEGKVRSTYQQHTGISSKGLRNGHGGRWLANDPVIYQDVLRGTGTALTPEQVRDAQARAEAAAAQGLTQKPIAELRAQAKELGLRVTKNDTPAMLARRIQKALSA